MVAGILLGCPCVKAQVRPADPTYKRAESALDRGDLAGALQHAAAFLRANPASAEARVLLARIQIGKNDSAAAIGHLREALDRAPNHVDALYYLSKLTGILSQQNFAALLSQNLGSARAHEVKAEIFVAQGRFEDAEREYLGALELKPGSTAILISLGDLQREQRNYQAALDWYTKALTTGSSNYDALYGAGASHWQLDQREEAARRFRQALNADPSSLAAKLALGKALVALGKGPEAIGMLEEVARADSHVRVVQLLLSKAYQAAGRDREAAQARERLKLLIKSGVESDEGDFTSGRQP